MKNSQKKENDKVTKLFSFEVTMVVHIIADTQDKATTELDEKGGRVTKREVKLLNVSPLFGETEEK
jgi:hypothetical protein